MLEDPIYWYVICLLILIIIRLEKWLNKRFDLTLLEYAEWKNQADWNTIKAETLWQYKTGEDAHQFEQASQKVIVKS